MRSSKAAFWCEKKCGLMLACIYNILTPWVPIRPYNHAPTNLKRVLYIGAIWGLRSHRLWLILLSGLWYKHTALFHLFKHEEKTFLRPEIPLQVYCLLMHIRENTGRPTYFAQGGCEANKAGYFCMDEFFGPCSSGRLWGFTLQGTFHPTSYLNRKRREKHQLAQKKEMQRWMGLYIEWLKSSTEVCPNYFPPRRTDWNDGFDGKEAAIPTYQIPNKSECCLASKYHLLRDFWLPIKIEYGTDKSDEECVASPRKVRAPNISSFMGLRGRGGKLEP